MTPTHRLLLLFILTFSLNGCSTTPASNYYLLSAEPATTQETNNEKIILVGVGPLDFPAYLDRNKIVIMTGNNSLRAAEYHRWAEPLESNFARVLAEDLAAAMPNAEVHNFPWRPGNGMDVQVYIKVLRFDADSRNMGRLGVRWELTDRNKNMLYPPQSREYRIAADSGEYEALVEALSRCVSAFSRDLAESIRQTKIYATPQN